MNENLINESIKYLLATDRLKFTEFSRRAGEQLSALEFIEQIITPSLAQISILWETNQIALSQLYMSGRLCETIFSELFHSQSKLLHKKPKMGIAALQDFHSLGQKTIIGYLTSMGYQIENLGYGLNIEEILKKAQSSSWEILLISTLMLSSALKVKELVEELKKRDLTHLKVIVGGAPFRLDPTLWKEVGAHGTAASPASLIHLLESMYES